jgi:OmpA-OmpF porin, OOP family
MKRIKFGLIAAIAMAGAMSVPASAEEIEVKGIVVTNHGHTLTVKTPAGDQTISLDGGVRVRSISGPLGGQKEIAPAASLIPGLPVTIEMENGVATEIDYKASDYKTAAQIEAGVQETTRRSEENQRRSMENARKEAELRSAYSQVGEWDVKAETTVYFKTGSAALSADAKKELLALAKRAKSHNGYVISVLGYADPTGDAAANERLSDRRAQAVINYIKQSGEVLPGKVLAASAMGEIQVQGAAADTASYASARRVTARVLTSKALLPQ